MANLTKELKINPEFKNLIPPLKEEEYRNLEQSLLEEGCRDAIVTWNGVIVDGHNRYEICQKHGIDFDVIEKEFANEAEAKVWIIDNQNARRNLSDGWKFELKQTRKQILLLMGKQQKSDKLRILLSKNKTLNVKVNKQKPDSHNTQKELAKELGWSPGKVAKADVVWKKGPEEIKEKVKAGEMSIGEAYRKVKQKEKKEAVEKQIQEYKFKQPQTGNVDIYTTDRKYNIIYADPPWSYWEGGQKNQSLHYKTMSIKEICDLPIARIAADNSILFLWVTYPILKESFKVIEAWGFKYSTAGFVWVKRTKSGKGWFFGCGSWTRANSELCLIATKGNPVRLNATVSQVIDEPVEEHSKKPDIVRKKIVELVGDLPKIELFARQRVEGWDVWGNEV